MDNFPPGFQSIFQSVCKQLDARGMECPQPVLECRQSLREMADREILHITADDPNTHMDFEVYCMRSGNELLATHAGTDGCFHYLIRKQDRSSA